MWWNNFFLILRAVNGIEILKNRLLFFVLTRHFTTSQEGIWFYHSSTNIFVSPKMGNNLLRKSCWKWAERYFDVFWTKKYEEAEVFFETCTLTILIFSKNFKFVTWSRRNQKYFYTTILFSQEMVSSGLFWSHSESLVIIPDLFRSYSVPCFT